MYNFEHVFIEDILLWYPFFMGIQHLIMSEKEIYPWPMVLFFFLILITDTKMYIYIYIILFLVYRTNFVSINDKLHGLTIVLLTSNFWKIWNSLTLLLLFTYFFWKRVALFPWNLPYITTFSEFAGRWYIFSAIGSTVAGEKDKDRNSSES